MNIKVAAFIVNEKSSNTLAPPPGVQGRGQKLSRTWGFTILFESIMLYVKIVLVNNFSVMPELSCVEVAFKFNSSS